MRVAVDVLGGDHAPSEILLGIAHALQNGDCRADQLLLAGPAPVIEKSLRSAGVEVPEILHTDDVIEGHESPIEALRRKPSASINLCVQAASRGDAAGLISFGNTGAAVAAATIGLGTLEGIRRPAIAVAFHGVAGSFLILDMGANPSPKAQHLCQYGLMGSAYARDILNVDKPRVALLNIGGEAGKGSQLAKETYRLLEQADLRFIGNVEGHELFQGAADVLVTEGTVGNMILKVVEGFANYLLKEIERETPGAPSAFRDAIRRLTGVSDFSEVGGATLMGVKGMVLIGHGRSKADAVPPAIRRVLHELEKRVNLHITDALARHAGNKLPGDAA